MESITQKNKATFIHLSTLTQYFVPFGNYIFPLLIWTSTKDKSKLIAYTGKQVLNFQLSVLLYSLILLLVGIFSIIFSLFKNISFQNLVEDHAFNTFNVYFDSNMRLALLGLTSLAILIFLKITEFFLIIYAAIKTSNGAQYKYPISIPFIK